MTPKAGVLAVLAVFAVAGPAQAQAPLRLTIDAAVQRAVEHAPRLTEAEQREAAALATWTARRATAWPSASVLTSYQRANHIDEIGFPSATGGTRILFPDITDNYRVRGDLTVPIYAFGRVSASMAAARSDVDAAVADRRTTEADIRLDATRAYWSLVLARESVRVLDQSLARTDAYVGDVKSRVDVGLLPPNDLLSAQVQRARQSVRLIQAKNDESFAELDLARLIGEPAGTRIDATSAVNVAVQGATDAAAASAADLVTRGIQSRSEHAALEARAESLRSAATVAMANLRPYLIGAASVEPARPNMRFVPPVDAWRTSWSLGVSMNWPIFDSGRSRAEYASLAAQANAVDARRNEFDDVVALEVRQRLLELESGRAAIAASAEAISAATEAHRVVGERFRAGVATSTDVLDAQVALLEAELEQTRLQASLRMTEARLLRAVGAK